MKRIPIYRPKPGDVILAAPIGDDVIWNPDLVAEFADISDEIEPGDICLSDLSAEEMAKLLC